MNLTNEELKLELDRLTEQVRESRKARGLPPESPKPFVPIAMAWTLLQRCKPLINFAIQYANIVDKANEIIELSEEQKEWVNHFKMDAVLIRKTDDALLKLAGVGITNIIELLTNQPKYEFVNEYLRLIYYSIELTKSDYGEYKLSQFTYDHTLSTEENNRLYKEITKEVKRLNGSDYFKHHYKELSEYYEKLKCSL